MQAHESLNLGALVLPHWGCPSAAPRLGRGSLQAHSDQLGQFTQCNSGETSRLTRIKQTNDQGSPTTRKSMQAHLIHEAWLHHAPPGTKINNTDKSNDNQDHTSDQSISSSARSPAASWNSQSGRPPASRHLIVYRIKA